MLLAGVLLKLGGYGIIKVSPFLIIGSKRLIEPLWAVLLPGAVRLALLGGSHTDTKAIIAYSSVIHIGLISLGITSGCYLGLKGAVFIAILHGALSSGIFFIGYLISTSANSRNLLLTRGTRGPSRLLMGLWFLLLVFNLGAPPSLSLGAEILLYQTASLIMGAALPILLLSNLILTACSLVLFSSANPQADLLALSSGLDQKAAMILCLTISPPVVLSFYPLILSI